MRRNEVCRGAPVRVVVGFRRLASELFSLDAPVAIRLRELLR